MITVETVTGKDAVALAPEFSMLGECLSGWPFLAIKVPNLVKHTRTFLNRLSDTLHAVVVRDGDRVVGGTYGHAMGLNAGKSSEQIATLYDPSRVYWISLTAIVPEYQGRGISHMIYNARDPWIIASGKYDAIAHVLVHRPDDHPLRPANYAPLDAMWEKRGYRHMAALDYTTMSIDASDVSGVASEKTMQLWVKDLK